ncbi:hypothetical protein TanjilG_28022 [Lupinus angustifolius]|uniref:Uncharacterized protein n=1 Tax=Lupinus angustifolius TaxID=3871 RepID=A0A4P1RG14_LUPAN|nr:hypothetical protein TanjilG_28022 [Lupinus angustifolius]
MATTTRLFRTSNPIQLSPPPSSTSTSTFRRSVGYKSRSNLKEDHNMVNRKGERKAVMVVKASMAITHHITTSQPEVRQGLLDLAAFLKRGCFLVIESYKHYFHTLSHSLEQGHLVHLLIEAIDMFLVGTALLTFGVSLFVMFVGPRAAEKESLPYGSNLFGLFYMKTAPRWVGKKSIEEVKLKIGHAVMMILQVGVLEKLKDIPFVTGLDLACFAAAVFTSSASIFVLSRLHR